MFAILVLKELLKLKLKFDLTCFCLGEGRSSTRYIGGGLLRNSSCLIFVIPSSAIRRSCSYALVEVEWFSSAMVIGFLERGGFGRVVYESRIYYWGARGAGTGKGAAFTPNLTFLSVMIFDLMLLLVTLGY